MTKYKQWTIYGSATEYGCFWSAAYWVISVLLAGLFIFSVIVCIHWWTMKPPHPQMGSAVTVACLSLVFIIALYVLRRALR